MFIGSYPNVVNPYMSVFFRSLIYAIADKGVECHVIAPVSFVKYRGKLHKIAESVDEYTEKGTLVKVYHPRVMSFSAKRIGKWNTMYLIERSTEQVVIQLYRKLGIDFDCVYGHFFLGGGLSAARIAQRFGVPAFIAYGECSFETEVSSKYTIRSGDLKGVKGIIAVSSKNRDDLTKRDFAKGIPVLLSVNAVNKAEFYKKDQIECRKRMGLPQEGFLVGFVGYFIERKGSGRLLEACRELEGVKLAFAGSGGVKPEGENVVFCRSLPHEEICDFLNAVDAFVLPTRNEGCSNALLEAMACDNAIVSSNLPFNWDVLNRDNAILIDPDDVEQIRAAVIKLRDNSQYRAQIAANAMKTADKFSLDRRADNILAFMEQQTTKVEV